MKIKKARKVMRDAFEKDPNFKYVYIANVGMYLYDNREPLEYLIDNKEVRERVATEIIDLIFN